jgi:hypothetical protein
MSDVSPLNFVTVYGTSYILHDFFMRVEKNKPVELVFLVTSVDCTPLLHVLLVGLGLFRTISFKVAACVKTRKNLVL